MILADNQKTEYSIVIGEKASAAIRHAGEELAAYLNRITGAVFPIKQDTEDCSDKEIILGETCRPGAPCKEGLIHDGYRLKTEGDRLFIIGENDRAVHYGIYLGLLENHLGCRFLAEGVERIPSRNRLCLSCLDETVIPPLEYRETFWYASEMYPDVTFKRGFNSSLRLIAERDAIMPDSNQDMDPTHYGGFVRYWGFAHTLFSYVSPDEYFDTHPEYFSMIDGKRIRERTQLCLTNPEVLEITKKKLRQNILEHPECKIFSLTQMDWYNPCQCPECARVDAEEGAHSGTMLRFVNACAASIAEEFPDVIIDTFAYQFTRQAPKITKPLPNVCVRICSIECCFVHPLEECNEIMFPFKDRVIGDAHFQDDIRDWGKICNHMYVWDYTTNYRHYLSPFPNFHVLQANIKFFLANGVKGLFEQGNAQSVSGEFGELRMYLISKLMWDPDTDVEQAMQEFLTGYYGMAAAPIREYIRLIRSHMEKTGNHLGIYDDPRWYLTKEVLDRADELWDEAEALAADEAELSRIRRSRLQVRYARVILMDTEDPERAELVEQLINSIREYGITYIRESRDLEQSFETLRAGGPYR